MSIHSELFLDKGADRVHSAIYAKGVVQPFSTLTVGNDGSRVTFYLYDLATIEKIQLELESLARELRDVYRWSTAK